jgi:hypothetical protein
MHEGRPHNENDVCLSYNLYLDAALAGSHSPADKISERPLKLMEKLIVRGKDCAFLRYRLFLYKTDALLKNCFESFPSIVKYFITVIRFT